MPLARQDTSEKIDPDKVGRTALRGCGTGEVGLTQGAYLSSASSLSITAFELMNRQSMDSSDLANRVCPTIP
jgi:hypothetical protein